MRKLLITLLCLTIIDNAYAQAPTGGYPSYDYGTRAQLGSKVVGFTVITSCPFDDVVAAIKEEGIERFHADYTEFPAVLGQENCPANYFTVTRPLFSYEVLPDGISVESAFGVTIGIHYRTVR